MGDVGAQPGGRHKIQTGPELRPPAKSDVDQPAAVAAAAQFVRLQGSDLDRARLSALLGSAELAAVDLSAATHDQLPDGGFGISWSGGESSLDATCYRLSWLADFGPAATPVIERAIDFIAGRQRSDGSFEEHTVTSAAPPWARPGDLAARLYLTANCGFWLSWRTQIGRSRWAAIRAAAACLATQIGPDGRLPSYLHSHWLAIPVLRRTGFDREADGLHWALAFRLGGLGPTALAWLLAAIADEPIAGEARQRLLELQEGDGRWSSEDGSSHDVATTLAAIRVLRHV